MMKLIFYCLLAYLVYRLISFWQRLNRPARSAPPPSPPPRSGNMVKDEICQTYLPQENALREIIDGEERFFCSPECRRKCLEERNKSR